MPVDYLKTPVTERRSVSYLSKLDREFLDYLAKNNSEIYQNLTYYRDGMIFKPRELSEFLLALAPLVENFVAELFDITSELTSQREAILAQHPILSFKQYYVLKHAKRKLKQNVNNIDFNKLNQRIKNKISSNIDIDPELTIARYGQLLLLDPEANQIAIDELITWCVAALTTKEGREFTHHWISFKLPKKLDFDDLVPLDTLETNIHPITLKQGDPADHRQRDGFELTDPRMSTREQLSELDYCVYCHRNDDDFCSKGFPAKKKDPERGLKKNLLSNILTGCPLDEKISEMQLLRRSGLTLAALAVIMIDNPLCPATGHRICNDCMKSCIYQKQDPVAIPQTETGVLTDVLALPWGVEIYDLLTRWNPLRATQWLPKSYNGRKILVMGMGPAGFTLAYHLLQEGCAVVGADGLKIEKLDPALIHEPIKDFSSITESLDERLIAGFGGVAEYGITVRWDKNFLKLIYITLMRCEYFQLLGDVRFGGTLTIPKAWELGFDHISIAVGAGLPQALPIENSLAPGMRQANDFLMALQLSGAAKASSLASLQLRMPVLVIGSGLTAIDTATEAQAYYIKQIEKLHYRYQILRAHYNETTLRAQFTSDNLLILDEMLDHAQQLIDERARAAEENREPNLITLLRDWGGVTIVYRRRLQDSPAYRLNHEEVSKAFEEGIYYAEQLEPVRVELDEHGWTQALICRQPDLAQQRLAARSILVATGAKPNVAYAFEHKDELIRQGFQYQCHEPVERGLAAVEVAEHVKSEKFGPFTSYQDAEGHQVTFIGDTHPVFHGSVVNAMASAKRTYPYIMNSQVLPKNDNLAENVVLDYKIFREKINNNTDYKIIEINTINSQYKELVVHAPLAAASFQPGQFYRVQTYEQSSPMAHNTRLHSEALALLGIQDPDQPEQLRFIIEMAGVSSELITRLAPGDPISLMGPTGVRTKIPDPGSVILVIGGPMAIVHLLSYVPTIRSKNIQIIFLACFDQASEVFYRQRIETLVDGLLWSYDFPDLSAALAALTTHYPTLVAQVQQVLVIGDQCTLKAVERARQAELRAIPESAKWVGSVYAPMQCMLKGVCAQCLQWQRDPVTGLRKKAVYACSWQHQPLELIEVDHTGERLGQNKMQEILGQCWLEYIVGEAKLH